MRTGPLFIIIALAILSLTTLSLSQAAPPRQPATPQLRLHRGTFDARITKQSAPTTALAAAAGPYAIIQLNGPITVADRRALEQTGVALLEYLPDYAYLVRGTPAQIEAAAQLPQVYARTSFTLADKLAPALLQAMARGNGATGRVQIVGWPDADGTLTRDLQRMGLSQQSAPQAGQVLQIANLESVRWIEPLGQARLVNDQARTIIAVDPVWQERRLFGAGQTIAVADSGLDTGDMAALSPDFTGRIVATYALAEGGHWDDNFGHGTHVAGSAVGAGIQSGANPAGHDYAGSFAGVAPEANLVLQAFEAASDGTIIGLEPDYYNLFDQAYDDGARLHTNSWGIGPTDPEPVDYGVYPFGSQRTDQFVWDHPDMTIFFAAGNSAQDGQKKDPLFGFCTDGNGVIDPDSLLSPGTAKNVITVGATENNRSSGGFGAFPWLLIGTCFAAQPIAADTLANNPNGMAAFSSRGPTDDGRAKPDIVAPGTNIISNKSHAPGATSLWGIHESNSDYAYSGGTSMATPLTAGAGVLVRQWLVNQGLTTPSAAVVKAVLLNTTQIIAPGQYGTGATQEIPFAHPNNVSGWGRVDLGFMTAPPPYTLWLDDHTAGLNTDNVVNYTHTALRPLDVLTNTHPLRVMLTWTDPPASLSAAAQLVNDLDLVVIGPDNATYYGNEAASGDRINNVEGVIVNNPPLGRYRIRVKGVNVPVDSQPYALAAAGPFREVNTPSVTVSKQANVTTAAVGQTVVYTYQVINSGLVTLTNLTGVDDKLGPVTFSAAVLGPKQNATGMLTYIVQSGDLPGPLVNTVTVSGVSAVDSSATAVNTAIAAVDITSLTPALFVAKTANVSAAVVGQPLTYTYQVVNVGPVTMTNITGVDDKLGPITFSPTVLAPGQDSTGVLTYTVQPDDLPGPLLNTVNVSGVTSNSPLITATAMTTAKVDLQQLQEEGNKLYLPVIIKTSP